MAGNKPKWPRMLLLLSLFVLAFSDLCSGGGLFSSPAAHEEEHHHGHHYHHSHDLGGCDHGHSHHEFHDHHHHDVAESKSKLPEELAEEEDMRLYGFSNYHVQEHHLDHEVKLSGLAIWLPALGCSLLVSLASLVCLIILPLIFIQGKPSKAVVDSLALFGAGAMLGDAFLHQLPHAFGGGHSHSHDHHADHIHHAHVDHEHSHSHSLKDLSLGLSILAGIVLFLLVEKVVRYVEANATDAAWSHSHHHHHHKRSMKLKEDDDLQSESSKLSSNKGTDKVSEDSLNGDNVAQQESLLRKRKSTTDAKDNKSDIKSADGSNELTKSLNKEESPQSSSNLVFGYLNLFSDGVHNFTDGMALGSAFLLHGSVGGWSRTLFLLAHELPQEIGDFGILVRSGFSVFYALFFNFLSALMALAGTALALVWGQDPGQSSLIEGFTAGGFIYISIAGVLAEMNNEKTTVRSTAVQIISLVMGMAIALCISLVE